MATLQFCFPYIWRWLGVPSEGALGFAVIQQLRALRITLPAPSRSVKARIASGKGTPQGCELGRGQIQGPLALRRTQNGGAVPAELRKGCSLYRPLSVTVIMSSNSRDVTKTYVGYCHRPPDPCKGKQTAATAGCRVQLDLQLSCKQPLSNARWTGTGSLQPTAFDSISNFLLLQRSIFVLYTRRHKGISTCSQIVSPDHLANYRDCYGI